MSNRLEIPVIEPSRNPSVFERSPNKSYPYAGVILDKLKKNKRYITRHLSEEEGKIFFNVIDHLRMGVTGARGRPIKNFNRFGQFYKIRMHLPSDLRSKYFPRPDKLDEWKKSAVSIYENLFPGYNVGVYLKIHYNVHDDRKHPIHFHITLSKTIFDWKDKSRLQEFKNLPDDSKKRCAVFFLNNKVPYEDSEFEGLLEEAWRRALKDELGIPVADEESQLVFLTTKEQQDEDDRKASAFYDSSNSRRTFKKKRLFTSDDGDGGENHGAIVIAYLENGELTQKFQELEILEFVKRYLIDPNRNLGVRCYPKGFFHSRSRYQDVIDSALKYQVPGSSYGSVMDLPIDEIIVTAQQFRDQYVDQPFEEIVKAQ